MKFSENSIKNILLLNNKINIKKLSNMLENSGFEINSISKINNNFKIILGKIIEIEYIENSYILYINIGKIENIKVYYNLNIFKKCNYVLITKENINKNKYIYDIYIDLYNNNIDYSKFSIGFDLSKLFNIKKDNILDISIPFNRQDCSNILGISKELSNIYSIKIKKNIIENDLKNTLNNYINIHVNKNICLYYYGRIISNMSCYTKTPIIIRKFLFNNNFLIKNNITDIINYISLKTGYYIHIIDLLNIKDGFKIDELKNDYILNNIKYNKGIPIINDINNNLILIPNITNNIININKNLNNIFLGCGIFNYNKISLDTFNFNKYIQGTNPYLLEYIIKYSTEIFTKILGGNYNSIIKICNKVKKKILNINFYKIRKVIGFSIRNKTIIKILKNIKCKITKDKIYIPNYRLDLNTEYDLIEEILKIYGINKIKNTVINSEIKFNENKYLLKNNLLNRIKLFLVDNGYQEIISYSLINKKIQKLFYPNLKSINIKNPMSEDKSIIRNSLIMGLIETIIYNYKRKENKIKIFESGFCFEYINNNIKNNFLISAAYTNNNLISNNNFKKNIIYKIKSDLENILLFLINRQDFYFCKEEIYFLEKNLSLSIFNSKNNKIGFIGIINNDILKNMSYNFNPIIAYEINFDLLIYSKLNNKYNISKFLIIKRDISLTIKDDINLDYIIKDFYKQKIKYIYKIEIIDIYKDKNINKKYKNITIRLYIQSYSKNLFNHEIDNIVKSYINYINFFIENIK